MMIKEHHNPWLLCTCCSFPAWGGGDPMGSHCWLISLLSVNPWLIHRQQRIQESLAFSLTLCNAISVASACVLGAKGGGGWTHHAYPRADQCGPCPQTNPELLQNPWSALSCPPLTLAWPPPSPLLSSPSCPGSWSSHSWCSTSPPETPWSTHMPLFCLLLQHHKPPPGMWRLLLLLSSSSLWSFWGSPLCASLSSFLTPFLPAKFVCLEVWHSWYGHDLFWSFHKWSCNFNKP